MKKNESVNVKIGKVGDAKNAKSLSLNQLSNDLFGDDEMTYHEVIRDQAVKLYLDIDYKLKKDATRKYASIFEEPSRNFDGHLWKIVNSIKRSVVEGIKTCLNRFPKWYVSNASDWDDEIISIHMVADCAFESVADCGDFVKNVVKFAEYDDMVDKSCYKTGHQSMRMIYCYTDEMDRQLVPFFERKAGKMRGVIGHVVDVCKGVDISKYLITNVHPDYMFAYVPTSKVAELVKGVVEFADEVSEDRLNYAELWEYLDLFPEVYYTDRDMWMRVGWSLGNLSKSDTMIDMYLKWSRKWKNFDEIGKERSNIKQCEGIIEKASEERDKCPTWSARIKELREMFPDKFSLIWCKYHAAEIAKKNEKDPIKKERENKLMREKFEDPSHLFYWSTFVNKWSGKVLTTLSDVVADLKTVCRYYNNSGTDEIILKEKGTYIFKQFVKFAKDNNTSIITYQPPEIPGVDEKMKLTSLVISNKSDMTYINGVDFTPNGDVPGQFNMFRGIKAKKVEVVDVNKINMILEHIFHLCEDDKDCADYMIKWLAFKLQHLGDKCGTCLILTGAEGCLKSGFCKMLMEMLIGEQYSCEVNDIDQIIAKFNSHTQNMVLIVGDEIMNFEGKYKKGISTMKNKITAKKALIERKGQDTMVVNDCASYIITTNDDNPVYIQSDNRRWFMVKCSLPNVGGTEYCKKVFAQLEDQDCVNHFYTYLMGIEVKLEDVNRARLSKSSAEKCLANDRPKYRHLEFIERCFNYSGSEAWEDGQTIFTSVAYDFMWKIIYPDEGKLSNQMKGKITRLLTNRVGRLNKKDGNEYLVINKEHMMLYALTEYQYVMFKTD